MLMPMMDSKLQDSHYNVGNSLDCVLYYCSVGNDVACRGGGALQVADGNRDLGGRVLCCDDLGSNSVCHLVASCSLLLDLLIYNLCVNVKEVAQGCRVVLYGKGAVPANCYDQCDLPP